MLPDGLEEAALICVSNEINNGLEVGQRSAEGLGVEAPLPSRVLHSSEEFA